MISILILLSFFIASCGGGTTSADRITELEGQVASLEKDNKSLSDEVDKLNEQIEEFDHNNRVIIILDKEGLLNENLVLAPHYVVLTKKILISGDETRVINYELESDGNSILWLFDNTTRIKEYLKAYYGDTVIFRSSEPNDKGEIYLEYWTCYTNNTYSCSSEVYQTQIRLK